MIEYGVAFAVSVFLSGFSNGFVIPKISAMIGAIIASINRQNWEWNPRSALLLFVYFLSACWSDVPSLSWWGRPTAWTLGVFSACVYFVLTGFKTSKPWLKWLGVALSVWALAQRAGLDPVFPLSRLPLGNRAVAGIGSPVDLGAILAMAAASAGFTWPLWIIAAGIWATGTRAAMLAAAVALTPSRLRVLWIIPAIFFIVAFRNVGTGVWPGTIPPKDVARAELWKMGWRSFIEQPSLLGKGPDTFSVIFQTHRTDRYREAMGNDNIQAEAHNDIVQALATTGIAGLVAYLWFVFPLLSCAPLLALFVFMKFNPVSFEVLCCAALLVGSYRYSDKGAKL